MTPWGQNSNLLNDRCCCTGDIRLLESNGYNGSILVLRGLTTRSVFPSGGDRPEWTR